MTRLFRALGCALAIAVVGAAAQNQAPADFDASRAWRDLEAITAQGPRPSGSLALRQTRAYITREISRLGLTVLEQPFVANTPLGPVEMTNLIVRLPGRRADRIIVGGHYDTKLYDDVAFVGANDGGSSAALLIELVRALRDRPRELTYEVIWFDGEEARGREWRNPDNTYGSRYYVQAAREANALDSFRAMILVDMIGERNPRFQREAYSTPWLTDLIWGTARALGHTDAFPDTITPIEDDHLRFLEAGVPAVDIIDLDYAAWHTPGDTLDQLAPESLQVVGDVLLAALPRLEAELALGTH